MRENAQEYQQTQEAILKWEASLAEVNQDISADPKMQELMRGSIQMQLEDLYQEVRDYQARQTESGAILAGSGRQGKRRLEPSVEQIRSITKSLKGLLAENYNALDGLSVRWEEGALPQFDSDAQDWKQTMERIQELLQSVEFNLRASATIIQAADHLSEQETRQRRG